MGNAKEKSEYVAFETQDRTRGVRFRLRGGKKTWDKHMDRHHMSCSPDETELAMFFYSVNYVLLGHNLAVIGDAMEEQNVSRIVAFDPEIHFPPADARAAFIDVIEVHRTREDKPEGAKPKPGPETLRPATKIQ